MSDFATFVEQLKQAFGQDAYPMVERFYKLDEYVICLRFAGNSLIPLLTPALAHLAIPPHPTPHLTVAIWDSDSTGIAFPAFSPPVQAYIEQGQPWGITDAQYHALYLPDQTAFYFLDHLHNWATFWIESAQKLTLADGGAPLLTILHWWLGRNSYQVVHGAVIGTDVGGVLLIGKGGSGKSTTALNCLHGGWFYVADDYCLISNASSDSNSQPIAHALYSSGKLHWTNLAYFSRLQSALSKVSYAQADKALFFFAAHFPKQVVKQLPLRAIFLPKVMGQGRTRLRQASPATLLLAMAPSTVFQLHGGREQTVRQLGHLVRQLPTYILELGTDWTEIPTVMADFLAGCRQ